jgi:hypothetical protein
MVTRNDAFPSKYLKAEDLKGPTTVEIEAVIPELLKNSEGVTKEKQVAYFKGHKKCLVLNATNFDSITDITSEADTDNWIGHKIVVFPTTTTMGGKRVACIRVQAPGQKAMPAAAKTVAEVPEVPDLDPPPADFDDSIPF